MLRSSRIILLALSLLISKFTLKAQVDNYCVQFNSEEGIVNLGKIEELNPESAYTLQFWFCPSEWLDATAIVRSGTFSIRLGERNTLMFDDGNTHFVVRDAAIAQNQWTHVTLRSSHAGTRVHINNKECLAQKEKLILPCSTYSLWLGGGMIGRIDEVRLWAGILQENYDNFWRTTLNDLNPFWNSLIGYWKMDQEQCKNLVDYRGKYHGTFSAKGVERQKVTDNSRFKYLYSLAYGNIERYCDRTIDRDHYRLSNRICIIAAHFNPNDGHIYPDISNEEATYKPVDGDEFLENYQGRKGVLSLSKEGFFTAPWGILDGAKKYTIETWLCIDQWNEGSYVFRKETADGKLGISLRLGKEDNHTLIVRCNGSEFVYQESAKVGEWFHVAVCPGTGTTANDKICFTINGVKQTMSNSLQPSLIFTDLTYQGTPIHFGLNLQMKLDDTMVFNSNRDANNDMKEVPLPGPEKLMWYDEIKNHLACYSYDVPHRLTLDAFSVPGLFYRMRTYTEGMRGVKYILGVAGNNFQSWFAKPNERGRIADEITAIAKDEVFDGVDLDFEWPNQFFPWEWEDYAHVCEALHWRLLDYGKTKSISPHYVSCNFPVGGYQQYVDYFNFQVYDRRDLFTTDGFDAARQLFEAYKFPKDKTILSYATTTTQGHKGGKVDGSAYPQAYRYLYPGEESYNPGLNYMSRGGYDYYLNSYNQVIWRAKYIVDYNLGGIMYWDMGGDLPSSYKHSFARAATYYINSNVEKLVTEVIGAAISPENDPDGPINTELPIKEQRYLHSLSEIETGIVYNIINAFGLGTVCYNGNSKFVWLGASKNSNFGGAVDLYDDGAQWLIINHNNAYYLYCKEPEQFVEIPKFDITSQASFFTNIPKQIEISENDGYFSFRSNYNDEFGYLCASPHLKDRPVCQWEANDEGSKWKILSMPNLNADEVLTRALKKIDSNLVDTYNSVLPSRDLIDKTLLDLQGRRCKEPREGVFILKGKKVLL